MRYFIISDIHSYYDAMIDSLQKSGYDMNDSNHHLLVLGDLFDRGPDACKVFEYLYPLTESGQATIILGNHDDFLLKFLSKDFSRTLFDIKHNGHGETLEQLSGVVATEDNLDLVYLLIMNRYPNLLEWMQQFPLYIEIGDYIFVHGGIDGSKTNWKSNANRRDFIWGKEHEFKRVLNKTVVCGHTRVATVRNKTKSFELLFLQHPEEFDILYLDGKIMINRYVEVTKELNVLRLEL